MRSFCYPRNDSDGMVSELPKTVCAYRTKPPAQMLQADGSFRRPGISGLFYDHA